jgi:uncharacterized protein (TIGR02246 family)
LPIGYEFLMPRLAVIFPAAFLVLLSACTSAPPPAPAVDVASEQSKLRDLEANWVKQVAAKDFDGVVAHYTDDATLTAPGMAPARGMDAIRAAWKGMLDDPNFKLNFSADRIEISQSGDMAFTRGSYTATMTNPKTKKPMDDKGSYLTIFKKQADGNWKAIEDTNTSEMAP